MSSTEVVMSAVSRFSVLESDLCFLRALERVDSSNALLSIPIPVSVSESESSGNVESMDCVLETDLAGAFALRNCLSISVVIPLGNARESVFSLDLLLETRGVEDSTGVGTLETELDAAILSSDVEGAS